MRRLLAAALLASAPLLAQDEFPKRLSLRGVPNFAQVSPVLYRGAQPTAEGFRNLQALGVRGVLSMRSAHDDLPLLKGLGFWTFRIHAHQWDVETHDVIAGLKVVTTPNFQPVFVHCQAGKDRTGLIVGAYEVLELGRSVDEALAHMRAFGGLVFWEGNATWMQKLRNPAVLAGIRKQLANAPQPAVVRVP